MTNTLVYLNLQAVTVRTAIVPYCTNGESSVVLLSESLNRAIICHYFERNFQNYSDDDEDDVLGGLFELDELDLAVCLFFKSTLS